MPEGDTVWLSARRLNQGLSGLLLTVFDLRVPELATVDLRGTAVTEVVARGKHLLIRLDDGHTLHSHLRMDGSWYLSRAGQRPRRHPGHMIRAQLGNVEWLATGYRVHDLRLVATSAEAELVGHLGPDLLGPDWDLDVAVRRLLREPATAIAEALLQQNNLAGIGNL
ncbi:MAG: endonuclease [Pseudonocardiales bacterium]|nr:endonuclease [Pseudonocardiales bacterium]